MIQNFFINTILIKKRNPKVTYEDGIMKEDFQTYCREIPCRISSLNYKDLALLQRIDDVQRVVKKLYTSPNIDISPKDFIEWEGKDYQVIAQYKAQDSKGVHHNKYFIKLVE